MKRQGRGCDSGCKQKNNEKTIKSSLSGTKALLVFFALLQQRVSAENAFSCDVYADSCPDQWKFDGQCDEDQLQCRGGDCFDCDKCQQFHYDCNSCIENGCYWCPGDALCFNSPHYVSVGAFSSCPNADDYTQSTCTEPDNFFSDPMYSGQKWVFEMIHVVPVWEQGILGTGVRVRINDSGVQSEHPDFDNRFDKLGSCNLYEIDPFDFQMDPGFAAHGTFVAGIVGGGANNNECGVGIAPEVTLSACYAFGDESQVLEEKLDWFDVSQNSWGTDGCSDQNLQRDRKLLEECPFEYSIRVCDVCDFSQQITSQCENAIVSHCSEFFEEDEKACSDFIDLIVGGRCQFNVLSETDRQGLLNGITDGRDGKGIIYVFASGNAFGTGDDTNFQGFTNTRFVISVGAVGKDAIHASYSTPGASIFISAPGGDNGNDSNIITTTLEGGCIDATIGTSFACPVVSGVIALVLESNPDLTWRDVQGILAISSQSVEDQGDDTATTNAAGFWHSNLYGFGVVDAKSAVNVAKSWELYEREQMLVGESGILDIPLSDDPLMPLKSSISFSLDQDNFIAESVAVFLDVTHFSRGHLEIVLTSPQGTKSVLQPGKRPENTQLEEGERWKLLTVRNWGESPEGDWELSVADLKEGDVSQCADRPWALLLDDFDASCLSLEQFRICENGQLDPFDQLTNLEYDFVFSFVDNGFKAAEACCACGGGIGGNEVQDTFKQWMIVVYGRYSGDQPPIWAPVLVPTVDYSCNILNDKCPSKLDGICDSLLGDDPKTGCEYGDCVDCNFCSNFDFDCEGCAGAKGCYYCPGDATCYNSPLYSIGSCTKDTDYIGDVGTCANSSLIFNDPLYPAQSWAYEMINVIPIWEQNIFGRGVKVRINDNGVNGSHLEFLNRFDLAASCSSPDPDSNLDKMGSSHGTLVASIVAAAANNAECAVGIAPETTISSCNVFLETEENLSLTILSNKIELYDISQNSWGLPACSEREDIILRRKLQINICPFKATGPNRDGPCDICDFESQYLSFECEESIVKHCKYLYEQDISACLDFLDVLLGGLCVYDALPEPALDALKTGILEGRDGKGIIYVFASGNDFDIGDDVNFGGLTNSRFTISVGAVGKDSLHASYSTPGAALFLSGPGGDHESVTNQVGATADGGCADAGIGTSFACPVVSGVIALMLEANPDLTWRDVQGVLASTSKMVFKDPYDTSRVRNAAGIYHSNFYGFGIVDAEAAVKAAQSWDFYGPEKMLSGDSGEIDMLIQDDASALGTSVVSIDNSGNDFITESVVVLLDLDHFSRGDLEVTLTSPSNTASTLHPGKRLENTQLDVDERWKLMTVRAWGENAVGDWTLSIRDLRVGDATNCADAPFLAFFDNLQVTCDLMAYNEFCVNGSLNGLVANDLLTLQDNGRTIQTACCECGGGVSPTNISLSNELRQWRLVVYGREGIATRTPTDLPSSRPTERPVVQPSSVPSTTSPITTNAPSIVQSSLPALKTMQPQTQPLSSGSSSEAFALFSFSMFGVSCFGFLFGFLFGFF